MVSTGNELLFDAASCHRNTLEKIYIYGNFSKQLTTREKSKLMSLIMHNFRLSICKCSFSLLHFFLCFLPSANNLHLCLYLIEQFHTHPHHITSERKYRVVPRDNHFIFFRIASHLQLLHLVLLLLFYVFF